MDKYKMDNRNQKKEGMLSQKTYEDFNKQKPNPTDPNQIKNARAEDDLENKPRNKKRNPSDNTKESQNGNEGKGDSQPV